MDRLAARIAEDAARPAGFRYAGSGFVDGLGPEAERTDDMETITQIAPPAKTPGPVHSRPRGPARPLSWRGVRRRPTPIIPVDPAVSQTAVITYVRNLCEIVLRSNDVGTLADFASHYDQAALGPSRVCSTPSTSGKAHCTGGVSQRAPETRSPPTCSPRTTPRSAEARARGSGGPTHTCWDSPATGTCRNPFGAALTSPTTSARELPSCKEMWEFMRYPDLPQELAAR
ncbi:MULTISPECIES: hypothetical protein [Streptomyces]|uniref:Uncharacterized protein n=1 Tax=Streptomyces flavovirens TaxID=52258 RepID=A0ABV8NAR3_9ACTN|nr:hypothetical protein [Streptomyces sp. MBT51]